MYAKDQMTLKPNRDMQQPPISIITVVRNAGDVIGDALASVAAQTVPLEHIIVDGLSTDNTASIVRDYEKRENGRKDRIVKVIVEKDQGIYDAMNKGISQARGRIIGTLNADDYYPAADILAATVHVMETRSADILYGDLEYVKAQDTSQVVRRWHSGKFSRQRFYWGWMPPHPTFFARQACYRENGSFNVALGTAADYELMLRFMLKKPNRITYLPRVMVKMRTGGISNASFKNRVSANRMDRAAWKMNGLRPYPWTLFFKPLRKILQFAPTLLGLHTEV